MEYTRIEHGNEVVLTYRPKEPVRAVVLRYERDLPARMQTAEEPEPPVYQPVEKPERKPVSELLQTPVKRKRNGLAVFLTILGLVLSVSCVGAGIWWIADDLSGMFDFSVSGTITPDLPGGNSGSNGNNGNSGGTP